MIRKLFDFLNQERTLLWWTGGQQLLDDVVAEFVLDHLIKHARLEIWLLILFEQLIDKVLSVLISGLLNAFLNNVGGEFVVREFLKLSLDGLDDLLFVRVVLIVRQHVLNHVVSVLVLGKLVDLREDLVLDATGLLFWELFEDTLDDPAAVSVHA